MVSNNIIKNFERGTPVLNKDPNSHKVSNWYSIFPIENKELIYGRWEDKIIWDTNAVESIPSPQEFKLDPNDENLILSIPEDKATPQSGNTEQTPKKEYKSKSRFMNKKDKNQSENEVKLYLIGFNYLIYLIIIFHISIKYFIFILKYALYYSL